MDNQDTVSTSPHHFKKWKLFFWVIAILHVIYFSAIWYQMTFAHAYGMDAHDPDFDTYWMTLFYAEIVVEAIIASFLWGYLWITRDRELDKEIIAISAEEEINRYTTFALFLAVYAVTLYWGISYFTEQDGAWHQVVTRDTSFTPSHIMIFYLSFPLYIIAGVASILYAYTRLPMYRTEGVSLPHIILVAGPFMILPNVGFNEWGHAFWFMEEFFSAPLHWGFVILGWCGLALFGVILQIITRVSVLSTELQSDENVDSGLAKEIVE
ncbi:MAG: bacterial ammonia monooxygenase, subunit AmoC [Methylophagaceae bacterium]